MIIDTVIYGEIPRVKIENCSSAPPEKRFIRPKIVLAFDSNILRILSTSTPGVETNTPNRYTANMDIVNKSLFLSSGI
jgi:hypothetical protein